MWGDQLRTDLLGAVSSRDPVRVQTVRMALGAIREAELAGRAPRVLSEDEVRHVLAKETKRREGPGSYLH